MRVAVIADIHGNVRALDAVLADMAARGIQTAINLGDIVSGPLWPSETYSRLAPRQFATVRGNHDRALAQYPRGAPPPGPGSWETLAVAELSPSACTALAALPLVLEPSPGVLACHGTPASDTDYLLEDIKNGQLELATGQTIRHRLGMTAARLVLCGHSHLPRIASAGAHIIVNPGSVGCPAYSDPHAPAHVSESGTPHARYAVLDDSAGAWTVDFIAVAYDWAAAAAQALRHHQPEWATALTTGRVRILP